MYEDEGVDKWRYSAKCRDMDTELWYPPRDKVLYKVIADQSKAICFGKDGKAECPVRVECMLYAEKIDEQHGIWGGLSHRERNALKRKAIKNGMTLEEWVRKDETNRRIKGLSKR